MKHCVSCLIYYLKPSRSKIQIKRVKILQTVKRLSRYRGKKNAWSHVNRKLASQGEQNIQSILEKYPVICKLLLGSLSNDHGDGNQNGKNSIGLQQQNNNFARASRFLYISLPRQHDYNVKLKCLISRFVKDGNTRQRLSFSISEL